MRTVVVTVAVVVVAAVVATTVKGDWEVAERAPKDLENEVCNLHSFLAWDREG